MIEVFVVLQTNDLGVDMAIATSLMEIGVLGAPLILAICQFINNRNTPRTARQKVVETVLLGSLSLGSVFLMWALFLIGSIWIWQETRYSPTSEILLIFACIYFGFIAFVMFYQFRYIVDEDLKPTIITYVICVFAGLTTIIWYIQGSDSQRGLYVLIIYTVGTFIVGTVFYPPISSKLYGYMLSLRGGNRNDDDNDNSQSNDGINSDFEKEWWWVWDEE